MHPLSANVAEGRADRSSEVPDHGEARPAAPASADERAHPTVVVNSLDDFHFRSRAAKTLLGIAVVAVIGWVPLRQLLEDSSTEAVINARLVTIRAPIDGEVTASAASLKVGATAGPGDALLRIDNRRAERNRLDDLSRLISQVEGEQSAAAERLESMRSAERDLLTQTRLFQEARVKQLEARIAELDNEIAGATATQSEADTALERASALFRSGTGSQLALDRTRREASVARHARMALQARREAVKIELEAARAGTFVGDSYNDRPRSSQRADEIALRIAELTADLRERSVRLQNLKAELTAETRRFTDRAVVDVVAPAEGHLWEVLTAPGEEVRRGQDLVRLVDCTGAVVTASVNERVYNRLRLGDPARFRLRDGGREHEGTVVGLTGLAAAPANLAIQPSALSKDFYRVTVAVPDLIVSGSCGVGRTGKVVFGGSQAGAAAAGLRPSL